MALAALVKVMEPPPVTVLNTVSRVMLLIRMEPGLSAESVTLPATEKAPVKSMLPSEPVELVIDTAPCEVKADVLVTLPATAIVAPPVPALMAFSSVLPVPLRVIEPVVPEVAVTPAEKIFAVLEALTLLPAAEVVNEASVLDSTLPLRAMPLTALTVSPLESRRMLFSAFSDTVPEDVALKPSAARPASSVRPPDRAKILALMVISLAARSVRLFDVTQLISLITVILPSVASPPDPVVTKTLLVSRRLRIVATVRIEELAVASVPVTPASGPVA